MILGETLQTFFLCFGKILKHDPNAMQFGMLHRPAMDDDALTGEAKATVLRVAKLNGKIQDLELWQRLPCVQLHAERAHAEGFGLLLRVRATGYNNRLRGPIFSNRPPPFF